MRSGLTVGIDVGTGSAKVVVFDPENGVLGRGRAGYDTHRPHDGWAEQAPDDWWTAASHATRAALDDAGRTGADVSSLSFSAMGGATVFVDHAGRPLRPALINLDRRAAAEHANLRAGLFAAAVTAASGNDVGAWNVGAKTAWLRAHEPEQFARTRLITSPAGYLLLRSTGRAVQSVSDAGIFDLFDLHTRDWSSTACDALGITSNRLPEVVGSVDRVGQLRADVADELGLTGHCTVVAGAEDTAAAALAAGALGPAVGFVSLGTAGVVGVVTTSITDPQPNVLRFPHVTAGQDLLAGSMSTAGAAMQWLSTITGTDVPTLLRLAEAVPAGAGGVVFLPYLAGELHPVNDPHARAIFAGLSIDTTPAHLARAVMEGSADAIAHNLEVIADVTDVPEVLRATGRPTESPAWRQSIADATGLHVESVSSDGAPLGGAIIAAAASEADLRELATEHVTVRHSAGPVSDHVDAAWRRRKVTHALYRVSKA